MKKRFLAWLLVLCLLLSAVPFQARAGAVVASGKINGFTWLIDDSGTLILMGSGSFKTSWSDTNSPWQQYVDKIVKVVIDDGVTGIDTKFLQGFHNMTDLSLPATLKYLGYDTFEGCSKLKYLNVDFGNPNYLTVDNVLFNKDKTTLLFYPHGGSSNYTIPLGVETVGKSAFYGNRNLKKVTFFGQVKTIEDRAFMGCENLETVSLPNSLTTIGASAFEDCGLTTITISEKVSSIGSYALDECVNLTDIQVARNNASFSSDGIALFNKDKTKLIQYPLGRQGSYTMPDTVQEFTTYAFWFNRNLTGLELSASLKMIPDKAFKGCSQLGALEIPHTVQRIGAEIFSASTAPQTVVFLGSAPAIPNGAPFHDPDGTVYMAAYYPQGDQTWSSGTRKAYGGKIHWLEGAAMTDFGDVVTYHWYFEPILWAVEKGITSGTSATTFSPDNICQRAQVVTFLWRAAGSPRPRNTRNPFVDVKRTDFYYNPVLWAVEKGITNGTSASTFGSLDNCNRAAVVTFLWRACGSPAPKNTKNPFVDVKATDFYYKPVLWAIEKGITNGVDATHFGPTAACTRAQVVTFLYRAYDYL